MKKWYILVALVVVLGILVAIPAPEVTTTDYSQIEQVAKKAIREGTSDIHNFDIKVSKDEVKVAYECSEGDIPMTIGEVTGVYAGIVDYAPEVGNLHAYAFNSNGQKMAYYDKCRRKPTIFSRGMNPYTPRKPYIPIVHITSWHGNR